MVSVMFDRQIELLVFYMITPVFLWAFVSDSFGITFLFLFYE